MEARKSGCERVTAKVAQFTNGFGQTRFHVVVERAGVVVPAFYNGLSWRTARTAKLRVAALQSDINRGNIRLERAYPALTSAVSS